MGNGRNQLVGGGARCRGVLSGRRHLVWNGVREGLAVCARLAISTPGGARKTLDVEFDVDLC